MNGTKSILHLVSKLVLNFASSACHVLLLKTIFWNGFDFPFALLGLQLLPSATHQIGEVADGSTLAPARVLELTEAEQTFHFDGLAFGWKVCRGKRCAPFRTTHTVDAALDLFTRLRERGVRSHFWI